MKNKPIRKILSLIFIFNLIFQQSGFAQMIGQVDIAKYLNQMNSFSVQDKFRPLHLRYFSYDALTNNFEILLDKGDLKDIKDYQLKEQSQELLEYFLIGITLPDENFWVNLRPDSESQIIDRELSQTDVGKILLEADLQLKKDTATFTSPETPEGRAYWNKLYQKAGQLFGTDNVTIPTLTRPWIVPQEVIIRETADSAYVYKATLKVMLEQDHLKNSADYNFKDERLKELNEYSSQLIRENIIPKLTKEVNTSKKYASLRQVFYSLILSRWFKARFLGKSGLYPELINKHNLNGLTSQEPWSKTTYFKEYQKSFQNGEYNIKEAVSTLTGGQVIRSYFSGGIKLTGGLNIHQPGQAASPLGIFSGRHAGFLGIAARGGMVGLAGMPTPETPLPVLTNAMIRTAASPITNPQRGKSSSSPLQIRTELTVPEGQKPSFFTNDYHEYRLDALLANPLAQIPDAVVNAVQKKLDKDIAEGKLLSAVVKDFGANEIDIHVTHRYGELNAAVQRLVLEAMKEGALKAQELGLLKQGIDVVSMDLRMLGRALRVKYVPHSKSERGSEAHVTVKMIGAGIGAANIKIFHEFFVPGATPLKKLGFIPEVGQKDKDIVRGWRAVVRRTEDVLKGNFDGDVWGFETSSEVNVRGKVYPSKYQTTELKALASQPNDFLITEIYPAQGSLLPSNEPVVSVSYQPVYGEKGELRTLNPTFLFKSQSGADAVGGIGSMFYEVNFVPGGPNGENFVATMPVTLKEARKAPPEGIAYVAMYGWQFKENGVIPREKDGIIDHVAINPPVFSYERKLANWLASIFRTHKDEQPYLAPFAAQKRVEPLRKAQNHLFKRAPKEADIDPIMDEVEAKVVSGELLSVDDDKADMGGKFGHNFTPEYMLAIDRATVIEAIENGTLSDGNIIGLTDKGRLKKGTTPAIGDDSHILMLGDKTRNAAKSHQLSFLGFTRGYLASMVGNTNRFVPLVGKFDESVAEKPYGRAQDYAGKEAKAAKANPYFYSHLTPRFFEILREVMPLDYMQMVDNMEKGWKHWQETGSGATRLAEPFSGNVSAQGIGTARYLVDIAGGERTFGILAGDKMGPAALNRIIREAVYAALAVGKFANGLVFEIWDAKAFDEHGNIPVNEIPESYADIADAVNELKDDAGQDDTAAQDFVRSSYKDGFLRDDLTGADKEKLAELIKKSGFVPTKRIYLDAQKDKDAIFLYLADSDRFNIKQVWAKKTTGWDINNFQFYLDRLVLGSSVTKLGILAGGEYIGKDDPVMVGHTQLMEHVFEFLRTNPLIIQGDMNGSHWLVAIPTALKYAVANKESHPILVGFRYTLSEDGQTLDSVKDVFASKDYVPIRRKMFEFNYKFKQAQLGGQFEPYGTNWRTVEAAYPLAKLLRALQRPDSPFLIRNKPEAERATWFIGRGPAETAELFKVATAAQASSPVVPPSDQEVSFANMQLRAALDRLEPIRRVFEGERFGGMVARPILTVVRSSADEPLPLVVHKGEVHRLDRHSNMIVARPGPETPGTLIGGNMTPGPTFVDLTLVIPKVVTKAEVIEGLRAVGISVKSAEASSDMLGVRGLGIPDLIVDEKTLAVIEVPNVGSLIDVKVWYDAGKEFVEPQPLTTEPLPVVRGSLMEPSKFTRRPRLSRTLLVGFNGFGRIGQMVERQIALFNEPDQIQVVAANDPEATAAGVAERLTYDTEHGQFPGTVHADKDGAFVDVEVDGRRQRIAISRSRVNLNDLEGRDLAQLPWRNHQVDVVIDAVGPFLSKEALEGHIIAGAKGVILTAPSRADEKKGEHRADFSLLIGVNDQQLHLGARVTDCASCTTNSYVPPQWVLGQESLKVIAGNLLTVHAYTGTQALVDRYAREAERGRAGARNMILTDTGAGRATAPILPHLKGMLSAAALRLPVGTGSVSVSTNIMEVTDDEPLTVERVNAHFRALAETDQLKGILATERGLVSSAQLTGRSESSILLEDGTQVILLGGRRYLVRTLHWYDNEWGYSTRIVDALYLLGEKLLAQEASPAAIPVKSAEGSNERDTSSGAKASSPLTAEKRKPFVGGNWKMAIGTKDEAYNLLIELAKQIRDAGAVETVIAPSLLHIPIVSAALRQSVKEGRVPPGAIKIAAQNMYAEEKGAFTGGTSAAQLKEYGVTHVILGHSEVRRNAKQEPTGESSANVNRKTKTALAKGLIPIVAVGESDAERTAGIEYDIVNQMVRESLANISPQDAEKVVIAYEPVWAIGTKKSATPEQAEQMHSFIRDTILSDMFGAESAAKIRILYGGSVTPEKAGPFRAKPNIDGFLVGGASLKADSFSTIVKVVADAQASSPLSSNPVETPADVGGIDFRVINMVTQPMGNFSGLNFTLPKLSHLEDINLDGELASIQKMISAGIMPSGERLKEYVAACYQKGVSGKYIDGIINFLVDICRMQEEEISVTPDDIKALLLVVDSK